MIAAERSPFRGASYVFLPTRTVSKASKSAGPLLLKTRVLRTKFANARKPSVEVGGEEAQRSKAEARNRKVKRFSLPWGSYSGTSWEAPGKLLGKLLRKLLGSYLGSSWKAPWAAPGDLLESSLGGTARDTVKEGQKATSGDCFNGSNK